LTTAAQLLLTALQTGAYSMLTNNLMTRLGLVPIRQVYWRHNNYCLKSWLTQLNRPRHS